MSAPASRESTLDYAHYRVVRRPDGMPWLLGSGGMGLTYKAMDTRLKIPVALKVIHPSRLADPTFEKLLVREARAAARVSHPNVAPVVFLHDQPGRVFYAMEFVDGVSLHEHLRLSGALAPAIALAFAEQIARGLAAIHERQIIHRDLKPANVMVVQLPWDHPERKELAASGGCRLKIIDFGLAKMAASDLAETVAPPTLGFRGTALYASPEQCHERRDLDARSDLYSLGCILWELLAGAPPFQAESQLDLLLKQISQPPPLDRLPALSAAVRAVLLQALAKQRDERFASALEMAEALAAARRELPFAAQEKVAAAPADAPSLRPEAVAPATGSKARPAAFAVLGFALLGGALALGLGLFPRGPKAAPIPPSVPPAATPAVRTVAVLPFSDLTSGESDRHFADGVQEDLIVHLVKLGSLRVMARTSANAFRDPARRDLAAIAQALRTEFLVDGRIRREAHEVVLTVGVIECAGGRRLWEREFRRAPRDLLSLESEAALQIAAAISGPLSSEEQRVLAAVPTSSQAAHDCYREGRALERARSGQLPIFLRAAACYERAVALDPNFALAWARLSVVSGNAHWQDEDRSPERLERARVALETAERLQPQLAAVRLAAGEYLYRARHDWAGALREFERVSELDPAGFDGPYSAAIALRRLGRWEESAQRLRRLLMAEPNSLPARAELAFAFLNMRRWSELEEVTLRDGILVPELTFEHAVARSERARDWDIFVEAAKTSSRNTLETRFGQLLSAGQFERILSEVAAYQGEGLDDPRLRSPISLWRAFALHHLGRTAEAKENFERSIPLIEKALVVRPRDPQLKIKLAKAQAGAGRRAEALRTTEETLALRPMANDAVTGSSVQAGGAHALALAGELDRACELLEGVLRAPGTISVLQLQHDPRWQPLHGHARFERMRAP